MWLTCLTRQSPIEPETQPALCTIDSTNAANLKHACRSIQKAFRIVASNDVPQSNKRTDLTVPTGPEVQNELKASNRSAACVEQARRARNIHLFHLDGWSLESSAETCVSWWGRILPVPGINQATLDQQSGSRSFKKCPVPLALVLCKPNLDSFLSQHVQIG